MININNSSLNSLNFSIKTNSGDEINLSMYDNKQTSLKASDNENGLQAEFSLRHAYGYNFHYSGNGIDENDKKQIDEALKVLQPKIDEFMKNANNNDLPSPKSLMNFSKQIKDELPTPKGEDHKQLIHEGLLNMLDKSLKDYNPNEQLLKITQNLYEKTKEQMQSFSMYF